SLHPGGRAVRFWRDPAQTADGLQEWSARDAEGWQAFDRQIPALARVTEWLHSMTPPDLVVPSLGDAVAALKLGNALRGLGGPSDPPQTNQGRATAVGD